MAASNTPAGGQPASPLVDHLGSRQCWLVGSGRPKDPAKPNGEKLKAPCDRNGYPLKSWQTAQPVTYAQAAAQISPPNVRFIGIRSSAAGADGRYVAGLDLDDVLNAGMGCIDPVAWHVWTHYPTYTEVTPSGAGLRMWWIVEGDAQPVSIKTAVDRKTGLSEVAFTAGVFNDKTCTVDPHTFNIGRELYYRADRFLIVTGDPYAFLVDGSPDPLRTITAAQLQRIASLVKAQHVPQADVIMPAVNADVTGDPDAVQIGATMTVTADESVIVNIPQLTPQPARVIEAQPVQAGDVQDFHKEYAKSQLESEAALIASAKEGGRNNELNRAAYQLAGLVKHGLLTDSEIERELADAAQKAGLSDKEAQATIKSGLNAGADKPRQLPRPPQPDRPGQPAQGQGRRPNNMQSMRDRINARREIKIEGAS
jgi:hypothetical protein